MNEWWPWETDILELVQWTWPWPCHHLGHLWVFGSDKCAECPALYSFEEALPC